MGGGGNDPYDDIILAACQKLNPVQPVTVASIPLQEVRLGTFDASAGTFTWNPALPLETTEEDIPPDLEKGQKQGIEVTTTVYHFNAVAVAVRLTVDLVNNIAGTTFSVSGQTSGQTAFAPSASTVISLEAPFSGEQGFTLESGNKRIGGSVDPTHRKFYGINADRSKFQNFSGSLQNAGCVVVPALPIGIAYQPPTKNGAGEFSEAQSTGVSITGVYTSIIGDTPPDFNDLETAIVALQNTAAVAGAVSAAAGAGGAEVASVLAAAVSAVAAILATVLQTIKDSGGSGANLRVDTPNTLTLTFTQKDTFKSLPALGPGAGDVIIYLQDATFAVYTLNGKTSLVPLGYRGLIPTPVPAASLQPGASQPANLSTDVRAQLLALDPVANGNPDGVTDTRRYHRVGELTLPFPTPVTHCWGFSQQVSTAGPQLITETDDQGRIVRVTLGSSKGAIQGSTVETCFEVTGPVDFEVWYDSLFDVFAYRDLSHMQSSAVSFEGTLPPSDQPQLGQEVTVVQNGLSVTTLTDAQGHYLLRSSSLQPGPAQLLLPTSGGSPITQEINMSL